MTTETVTIDPALLEQEIDQLDGRGDTERLAQIARLLLSTLTDYHRRNHDAWVLVGQCDMALELVECARSIRGARQRAAEMRERIRKATT